MTRRRGQRVGEELEDEADEEHRDRDGARGEGLHVVAARSGERGVDRAQGGEGGRNLGRDLDRTVRLIERGPDEEADQQDRRKRAQAPRKGARALGEITRGAQGEEVGAVDEEQAQRHEAAEERVWVQQVPELCRHVVGRVHRYAMDDVGPADAPQQRGATAADRRRPLPAGAPTRVIALAPELERDAARDQAQEDQQQREVKPREQARVPAGEGSERCPASGYEPDLVAIPDRPDRVDERALLGLIAADDTQQRADAEVEALEDEVANPEDGDQDVPECLQEVGGHVSRPGVARRHRSVARPVRRCRRARERDVC